MKQLKELMTICPGRVDIEINKHIIFGETATELIWRQKKEFANTEAGVLSKMCSLNTIFKIDALTVTKPMPVVTVYHYDFKLALVECLKQIEQWEPRNH